MVSETPLELKTDFDVNDCKSTVISEHPALLQVSRLIRNEARPLFSSNQFFIVANGPSHIGRNLQDLQHGVDSLIHLLGSHPVRSLTLVMQDNPLHGSMWSNMQDESNMQLAELVVARIIKVTINGAMLAVPGARAQDLDLPNLDITVPVAHTAFIGFLRGIFIAAMNDDVVPASGIRSFIRLRASGVHPTHPPPPPLPLFQLPHGLVMRYTTMVAISLHPASTGVNMAQDLLNLSPNRAILKWWRDMRRSLEAHRENIVAEIQRLAAADDSSPPRCQLAVGEGFRRYSRTMDHRSHARLPVRQRLILAWWELAVTYRNIAIVENAYVKLQLSRPLDY